MSLQREELMRKKKKIEVFDIMKAKGRQFKERETLKSVESFQSQVRERKIPDGFSYMEVS